MKNQYKIGRDRKNEIVVQNKECPNLHAEINYVKGSWILKNLIEDKAIFVNGNKIETPQQLSKNDKITVYGKTIYWSNYFYEGESQELYLKDILSYYGRISRSNFRALSLLSIGMAVCVFFLPTLLILSWEYINRGRYRDIEFDTQGWIENISPFVHTVGLLIVGIILLLLAIKRIRDTGNPIWKLLIPIYNLKILYFEPSKK
jgi:uncharacterized membrane protein YhaH (DUF805 family)